MEFTDRGIPFRRELELPITFKGRKLKTFYRADFVCFGEVVVDLKALNAIGSIEEAKMINYLKATKLEVGLVVNFGAESLQFKRLVRTVDRDHSADRDAESQP